MNTDTNPTTGRKAHVRGAAAAIIAAARAERGLHQASDVPGNYRVGREIIGTDGSMSGYGVAYPPKFAAAHMPFATTTRQLKRGFVILTEAEAAEIAVAYVAEDGRGVQAANEQLASTRKVYGAYTEQYPDRAEDYAETIAWAERRHAETLAKLAKARTRYGKILAKAQPVTEEVTMGKLQAAPTRENLREIDPELVAQVEANEAATLAEVAAAAPELAQVAETAAQAAAADRAERQDAIGATLVAVAAAKVTADRAWRQAIVDAAAAGLSHRAIAVLAGCTHPTVAKVLAEEAGR
jgi:hypothetical protein